VQQAFLQREREGVRQAMAEQLAQYRRVSAGAMARLSAVTLAVTADQPYALWQLQEAVAAQSGFSVISDAAWQPPRSLSAARQLLFPDAEQPDAFSVLTAPVSQHHPITPGGQARGRLRMG
jgi:hypothetical protein